MTKLIRNNKFTRITALLLVVAVIFGTMFALPVSAASGDKVTITFDYCYDSTGNTIKFQQTTVSDGYTVGTPGEELCKIFADGKEAYCIEPGHTLYSGNTLTEDGSTVWKNLGSAKQKAINLALLYGKPGSGKSLSGTEDQKWIATQLIVWEFVSVAEVLLTVTSVRIQSSLTVSVQAAQTPELSRFTMQSQKSLPITQPFQVLQVQSLQRLKPMR